MMPNSVRKATLRRIIWPALLPLLLVACEDEPDNGWTTADVDTVTLFTLSRPELIGKESAFDFTIPGGRPVVVEDPLASGNWDFAFANQGSGFALVPSSAFAGFDPRAGIAPITGTTFETLAEAPRDTSAYRRIAVAAEVGRVYAVRSRRATNCGFTTGTSFAKMEVLAINAQAGTMQFRHTINPVCNDRRLIPPD
jgi:hypothetical protein